MIPDAIAVVNLNRKEGADAPAGRQSLARPIPTHVGIRKTELKELPESLIPEAVRYQWKLVWDESVAALVPAGNPQLAEPAAAEEQPGVAREPARPVRTAPERYSTLGRTTTDLGGPAAAAEAGTAIEAEAAMGNLLLRASRPGPWARLSGGKKAAVIAGLTLALAAVGVWKFIGNSAGARGSRVAAPETTRNASLSVGSPVMLGPTGWRAEPAGDTAGREAGRRFSLYRAAGPISDYVVEFSGRILSKAMGWVFRVADTRDYYATKLAIVKPGAMREAGLIRYAVIGGEEGPHTRVPIPLVVSNDMTFKVRLDVVGPKFTTYIEGRAIDFWNDTRLRGGTFGFMNDREERAEIRSVRVSSPGSGGGQ